MTTAPSASSPVCSPPPSGAALIMALLTIIVLDCIVLGTLHLALQEQRIGANRTAVLQLRLDAESGARHALGRWTADIDSIRPGPGFRVSLPPDPSVRAAVQIERLGEHVFLLESVASEAPPRAGRAAARLLLRPPAIPPGTHPATAPVSATGTVDVLATATVTVTAPPECAVPQAPFAILAPPFGTAIDPRAAVAPAGPIDSGALLHSFDRLAALANRRVMADGDTALTAADRGVIIARGNIILHDGAVYTGLLVAGGTLTIHPGARVRGAVHARHVELAGMVDWDPCAVAKAVRSAGLDRPAPAGSRPWVPAF